MKRTLQHGMLLLASLALSASPLGFSHLPVWAESEEPSPYTQPSGWQKEGDHWKYINADGTPVKDTKMTIGSSTYFFDEQGWMIKGWIEYEGSWYFADSSGAMKTGWLYVNKQWFYLRPTDGVRTVGWLTDGKRWYYLDPSNGAMKEGWLKVSGEWYFFDSSGAMKTGWLRQNGKWYYFKNGGAMATGWIKVDNKSYYMTSDGSMAADTWITDPSDKNIAYYVNTDGVWVDTSYSGIPDGSLAEKAFCVGPLDQDAFTTAYGFLLKVDGKYGILNTDGTWLIDPDYTMFSFGMGEEYIFWNPGDSSCLILNEEGMHWGNHPGYGGLLLSELVLYKGQIMVLNNATQELSANLGSFGTSRTFQTVTVYPFPEDDSKRELYYWSPVAQVKYGPYPTTQTSYVNKLEMVEKENCLAAEYDPFLLLRQDNNTWTIYSPLNTKSIPNITKAVQLSNQTLTAWKSDGSFTVYNEDLTPIYSSNILPGYTLQCGTGVIDNSVMVKYKDAWYLVRVK